MTSLVPNPYFINIELFWPDGTRPDQNQIAYVQAYDVNGDVLTLQGQSGHDSGGGGWLPIYMQNIAAFFPPRERPNLRFHVVSTQSQVLHTTQVFNNISHNSTVRIVIGESDGLSSEETWRVGGQIRWPDGRPITNGTVRVHDVTNGSEVLLGSTSVGSTGNYSLTYTTAQFENNGSPHQSPNLRARVFDPSGLLLKESPLFIGASRNQRIDLVVELPIQAGGYSVFGDVKNELGLGAFGVRVEAYHVAWTTNGIQEIELGRITSDVNGAYRISYEHPAIEGVDCGSPPEEINLIVYAKVDEEVPQESGPPEIVTHILATSPAISPAAQDQRVDLTVDRDAAAGVSEYTRINSQIESCLLGTAASEGDREKQRWDTLNQLSEKEQFLLIVSRTTGIGVDLLRAYVEAWRITGRVNDDIQWGTLQHASLDPQVVYGLVRRGKGSELQQLLEVNPQDFFDTIVSAIEAGLIDRTLEAKLPSSPSLPSTSIQDTWLEVLAHYLGQDPSAWQQMLLRQVISDVERRKTILRLFYDVTGPVDEFFEGLVQDLVITAQEGEDLIFVFGLYDLLDRYDPALQRLYSVKAAQGWKTIADLATVTVEAWFEILEGLTLPPSIPGNSVEEKTHIYAQRLHDKFGHEDPEARFVDEAKAESASDPLLGDVVDFLEAQPNFDLSETGVDKYVSDLPSGEQPTTEVVDKLKQVQRVYRLTSDFSAVSALLELGLDSSVKIAVIEEGQFIADYEQVLGGLTAARAIHRKASHFAAEVHTTLVRLHQSLNDVGGSSVLPAAANLKMAVALTQPPENKFPNWVTLFGDLYNAASKHCQTVLSPGAYLVDLLEQVLSTSLRARLLERRPDLTDIELTCPNTDRAAPYIDFVNEILGAVVSPWTRVEMLKPGATPEAAPVAITKEDLNHAVAGVENGPEIWQLIQESLQGAGYLLTERAVLKRSALYKEDPAKPAKNFFEWVIEDDAWRFTIGVPRTESLRAGEEEPSAIVATYIAYAAPQTSSTGQELDVFPEHTNASARQEIEEAVFPFQLPVSLSREEIDLLVSERGTNRATILETFRVNPDAEVKWRDLTIALALLGLTPSEGDALLARDEPVREYWGFFDLTSDEQSVSIPNPQSPTGTPLQGTWLELLSQVSVFLHRSQLKYSELLELLDTEFIQDPDEDGPIQLFGSDEDVQEANYFKFTLLHLSLESARRISFFLRLQRKLGWKVRELDRYLMRFGTFTGSAFVYEPAAVYPPLAQFVRLSRQLGRPVGILLGYFADLDLRRTERKPRSVFDEIYLRGGRSSLEYQGLERVARGEVLRFGESALPGYVNYLRGALQSSVTDFELLWAELGPALEPAVPPAVEGEYELTLALLSALYRTADFCRAKGLTAREFFAAESLFEREFLPTPGDFVETLKGLEELDCQRGTGLSARSWNGLLDFVAEGEEGGPTEESRLTVRRRLAQAGGEILASYPNPELPESGLVAAGLGEVLSQERVARVFEVLRPRFLDPDPEEEELPLAPVTPKDEAFLVSSFRFFLGDEAESEVAVILTLREESARIARIWSRLRPELVHRARRNAVFSIVGEVWGARSEVIDALLSRALSSVGEPHDPQVPAWEDWESALGGWDTGEEELRQVSAGTRQTYWITPADGEYRFVTVVHAATASPSEIQIQIDGVTLVADAPVTVDQQTQITWRWPVPPSPIDEEASPAPSGVRKAGSVSFIRFVSELSAQVSLLIAKDEGDGALLPVGSLSFLDERALLKLWKALRVSQGLKLREDEFEYVVRQAQWIDELPLEVTDTSVAWEEVRPTSDAIQLNRLIPFEEGSLLTTLSQGKVLTPSEIAAQTGWDKDDVSAVLGLWGSEPYSLLDLATWYVLDSSLRLTARVDLPARQIIGVLLGEPTSVGADVLRFALRAKYTTDTWRTVFKPLRDKLRQRERDAFVGYLTTRNLGTVAKPIYFFDPNDLFGYFLIDVQMEPDTEISRIRLALNSIQLFVQRLLMGVEMRSALTNLDKIRAVWDWMQNYRVWEANRKVFLFPENWIEPELRDDKTELFKELEEELLQDDLTNERAEQILSDYLNKVGELSDLQVIGAYSIGKFSAGATRIYHIVARTRSTPATYYHRIFEGKQFVDGFFSPWKKIPLEIEADMLVPVVSEGRLHVFWPMVRFKQKMSKAEGPESELKTGVEMRLMSSSWDSKTGKWAKPRLSQASLFDPSPQSAFDKGEKDDEKPDTSCYHLDAGATPDGDINIALLKTTYPRIEENKDGSKRTYSKLNTKKLGNLVVRSNGAEFSNHYDHLPTGLGDQLPKGMALTRNAAVSLNRLDLQVEGDLQSYGFGFRGSYNFFDRVMESSRVFVAEFGYLSSNENLPFFFEMGKSHFFALSRGKQPLKGFSSTLNQLAQFSTFNHPVLPTLKSRFAARGPSGIMNRETQALPTSTGRYYFSMTKEQLSSSSALHVSGYSNQYDAYYGGLYMGYHIAGDKMAWGATQREFQADFWPSPAVQGPYPLPTVEFGYGSSYGVYNWELFFHLPMLIASRFSQDLRFAEAMKWLHYVFDPRSELSRYEKTKRWALDLPDGAPYWNFLPFFANKDVTDSLLDVFGAKEEQSKQEKEELKKVIEAWRANPFSPHLIARQRPAAYQKFVVMKYLDNLIAWGDQLFRQDTIESINQATQLYILADEILGKRPEVIEPPVTEPRLTYRELQGRQLSDFSNALVQIESLIVTSSKYLEGTTPDALSPGDKGAQSTGIMSLYFRVPRNEKLDSYWDTVQDRLFKIRNSMNIEGVKRSLALFEPPIDPALLVRARAGGLDLGTVLSQLRRPLPYYRFQLWTQKASDLVNELKSFGGALLSALEKGDAEQLALLRQDHELRMLNLVRKVRQDQIREAEENVETLRKSKALAEDRLADYSSREFMSDTETLGVVSAGVAGALETAAGVLQAIGGGVSLVPEITVGMFAVTTTFGGRNLQGSMSAWAGGLSAGASVARTVSSISTTIAGYERRQEDWDLQIRQADLELKHIDQQILAADIRVAIAEKELENHETQMEQAEEVRSFMQEKFTNRELYQWMVSQLSRTYQQVYKLTYDVAKTAERAFQFELGVNDTNFVQFGYMESLRQGLLAGEKMAYDLKRMDVAYLERNKREFEITKSVSLAALNPFALQELREKGACEFVLPELIYDLDHPGQYFRRIRAVRLSIPCVTGPYTSVSAKLSLLGSAIRVQSTADPDDYAYRGYEDPRFIHDVGGIQSIATSTAQDDSGLFELNFKDERYLPFEGAGAISRFRLELPEDVRQFDYNTISDVVVTVSYTARDAGGSLKKGAIQSVETQLNNLLELISNEDGTGLVRVFSLKREFPDALHQLLTSGTTKLEILPEHFPYVLRQQGYELKPLRELVDVHVTTRRAVNFSLELAVNEEPATDEVQFSGEGLIVKSIERGEDDLLAGWNPETWTLTQEGVESEDVDAVDDVLFVVRYKVEK